jgi:hypothetical protein
MVYGWVSQPLQSSLDVGGGVEMNILMVEIPTPKPYIFMIRMTRQIKCIIAQALRGHTPPPT